MSFTASTLQIGCYILFQQPILQAAQVTFTEPDGRKQKVAMVMLLMVQTKNELSIDT